MAYRYGDRDQIQLLPQSIEDYIGQDDPVRVYDAFVEALDFNELGIVLDEDKVGNSEYDPKAMVKLFVYGYSYGLRSSRKLERATHHNVSFMWLMGGLKPDHKTIARFRKDNVSTLKNILKQCARMCIKLDLIAGNTLFVDGSKFRANASINNTWDKTDCERSLKKIDKRIDEILAECEAADEKEENEKSLVKLKEELRDKKALKSEIQNMLKELKETGKKTINTTDKECTRVNSRQGTHAGYSVQAVVDERHGLIVSSDVVSRNNDLGLFAEQINQANETIGKNCDVACADSGYADTTDLEKVHEQGIKIIVPSQRQAKGKKPGPFDKRNFKYDSERDCYICPEGKILKYCCTDKYKPHREYSMAGGLNCRRCRHFGVCTTSKEGRKVTRLIREELRQKLEAQYEQPESQKIYKLRDQKVEIPFGHIKRNLGSDSFLLRGREGAKAEISILQTCFNITRMMSIIGIASVIEKLIS